MHYHIITIFPGAFEGFRKTSLIAKAQESERIHISLVNPRDFCIDKHQQIDDTPYGGGAGMLMKAQPVIDAIQAIREKLQEADIKIILLGPSEHTFTQAIAHDLADSYKHIIFICGRYEGIDHRVQLRCEQEFGDAFSKISLGQFVTLGGETPTMVMIEALSRLLPGVIKEEISWQDESYRPDQGMKNIEYPQYTRPEMVEDFSVPDVLLSGHHAEIKNRKESESGSIC